MRRSTRTICCRCTERKLNLICQTMTRKPRRIVTEVARGISPYGWLNYGVRRLRRT